eukprot:TRINITY_DN3874_c0_g1_i10.p1 TRINITY_DN3874_c0_g1~~TRINITY_DN3874_c0_g1_i10.p1  ORF type:complete len:852 (-),score=204.67 TRINITY_DN3874_c0_g1_i10:9-2564(-)
MRSGVGVLCLLLSSGVLAGPSPLSWDDFDRAGAQISSGLSKFGEDMERGISQGVNTIADGFDKFEDKMSDGYAQLEDSIQKGYDKFEDEMTDRLDSWGINQEGVRSVEQRFQNSLQDVQDAIQNQAQIISKVEMPDMNQIRTHMRESLTPLINYNSFTPNFGFNSWINRYARKWWEGENVCVTREELEDEDIAGISVDASINLAMQISKCEERFDVYTCQYALMVDGERKAYRTTYSCCRGFKMDENKECKEFDIRPVEETIASLDGADFLAFLSEENLVGDLKNSTIFLPDSSAIDKFRKEIETALMPNENDNYMTYNVDSGLLRKKRDLGLVISEEVAMRDMLLGHVSSKIFNLNDVSNNEMIPMKSGGKVRMTVYNTYPKRTVLANCALVTSKDHHTETSTIHVVDRIIKPTTRTIGEILSDDVQFRTFVSHLEKNELDSLKSENGTFTVFAPSESAFEDLDELWREKIGLGKSCSAHILSTHILPTVVCSGVIAGRVQVTNNVGERIELRRDEEGRLFVEDRELIVKDVVAKNGVIHVIDSLILPKSAKTVTENIKERNGQKFLDLMAKANLMEKLSELKDFTLLMPSAKALKEMDESVLLSLSENPDQLEQIMLHHILPKANEKSTITRRTSMQNSLAGKKHHINHNTVSCARLQSRSCGKVCSGSVVEVDRLLIPPGSSILQILESSSEHSKFLELLEKTKLSEEIVDGHFTVFAPTNQAFDQLEGNLKSRLLGGNLDEIRKVLQQHIIPDIVCCSSAPYSGMFPLTHFTRGHRSLSGHTIMMTRGYEGHVQANGTPIDRCDTIAVNGLLHSVNKVMLPRYMQQPSRRPNLWDPFNIGSFSGKYF